MSVNDDAHLTPAGECEYPACGHLPRPFAATIFMRRRGVMECHAADMDALAAAGAEPQTVADRAIGQPSPMQRVPCACAVHPFVTSRTR